MAKLEISELDFDDIKTNFKTYLQQQDEFKDYNLEGSGLSILLDLLAYNTHYLAYNANMLANEMFLDSADLRNSIVSQAAALGYTPTSPTASKANIDIVVNNATGSSLTMPRGTAFTTTIDEETYQFVTNTAITITPSAGVYRFSNVDIYEGTLVNYQYTVNTSDPDQRFIIPSVNADTATLTVQVQTSSSDTTTNTFTKATSITELNSSSKVYFLKEVEDGRFEINFGDGIIGQSLSNGNLVILKYVVTNKTAGNSANSFSLATNIGGFSNVTITTNTAANGGAESQTKQSIKFTAPKFYAAQDRTVTVNDYKARVIQLYPNAKSVSVWGGEDNDTPYYGRVYISINPNSGINLTETAKTNLVTQLKKYNVASVTPTIVDPLTTDLVLTVTAKYDENSTTKSAATIKSNIITTITNFNSDTLQKFDGVFRYSKVTGLIDDTDSSILSNVTTLKMRQNLTPTLGTSINYEIKYNNAVYHPHAGHTFVLETTGFKIDGDTSNIWYFDDDGNGNVRRYRFISGTRTYADNSAGTINYTTGVITINAINIASIENVRGVASSVIEFSVPPNSNDIVPVRNQVLNIDVANSLVTVEADDFVGGSANAGVGYNTTSSY